MSTPNRTQLAAPPASKSDDTATETAGDHDDGRSLERTLGLTQVLLFGVGGIVGAGIYAIIGEAARFGGSLLWVSFLASAVVALLSAATYAELVSRYPDAGGSFEYVKQAFGLRAATVASVFMLFTGVVAAAAIAISFSSYLSRLIDVPATVTTLGVIAAMGLVNVAGAAQASWFNTLATVVTLIGLGAVVAVSVDDIGTVDLLVWPEEGLLGLGTASALIFFSFIGYEDLVKLAEETKEPEKTMPRGVMISGFIVLAIYLVVAVAAVSALGPDELASSSGPLAAIMDGQLGPRWAAGIVAIALFATSKTILSNIMGAGRLVFDVGRDAGIGWLEALGRVNGKTNTPIRALIAVVVAAMAFGLIGNLGTVAAISNILVLVVFLVVNLALIRIRKRGVDRAPFHLPLSIGGAPATALAAIIGIVALLLLNLRAVIVGAA